jgi:hypothetical protein
MLVWCSEQRGGYKRCLSLACLLLSQVQHSRSALYISSRLFGQFLTYPLDVVRRRMQVALANGEGKIPTVR